MNTNTTVSDFQFDPSDYPVFQEKVRRISKVNPFEGSALKEVIIDSDAIINLPIVMSRTFPNTNHVLVVMDKTSMLRDQASLKPLVAEILSSNGYQLTTIELEGDQYGVVHPDFEQVNIVHKQIHPGMIVVGLGSGVVADICKYACFMFDKEHENLLPIPLILVATANSVPAYSSSMSIISRDGVKRTWPTRLPNVILCDLKVLRDCPHHLSLGGVGDMCGMYIASLEWFFGIYLGVVADSPASRVILDDARSLLIQHAAEIGKETLTGIQIITKLLVLGGLAMTFANDSTPMSGYEHGFAHLLDMGAEYFHRPIRNHGSQVAVAGIYVLIGLERFLDTLDPSVMDIERFYPDANVMERRIAEVFLEIDPSGAMGAECWRDFQKKLIIWNNAQPQFIRLLADWPELKHKMREMILPAKTYVQMLHAAGHPLTFDELGIDKVEAIWAFRNAYMLRKRLSTTDLMIFMDWIDEDWIQWVFSEAQNLINQVRSEEHRQP